MIGKRSIVKQNILTKLFQYTRSRMKFKVSCKHIFLSTTCFSLIASTQYIYVHYIMYISATHVKICTEYMTLWFQIIFKWVHQQLKSKHQIIEFYLYYTPSKPKHYHNVLRCLSIRNIGKHKGNVEYVQWRI